MSPDTLHTPPPRRLRLAGVIAAIVVLAIVVAGVATRANDSRKLRDWTNEQSQPTVNVVSPQGGQGGGDLNLPGRLQAYSRAPIFARTSGYLKYWKADIGQKVKAGEVLAEIETPDLDQQLLQAKADLASARANEALAQTTAKRWKDMRDSDSVSKQEVDEKTGDYDAKHALATAAEANLERIQALKGFAKLTAPFDGIVTARETDVGALINAGGGAGPAMFVVSDISKLRVYVNVPQNYAPAVRIGAKAALTMPEYPNRTFAATVEASSQSVDVASGTTRMQLALDNAGGELMPGGYASVRLPLLREAVPLHIPASALIFNKDGLRVATVGPDDKVLFKTVTIARDLGREIEIASGLAADDRIITAPPDGIADGDQVRVSGAGKPATASEKQDVKG